MRLPTSLLRRLAAAKDGSTIVEFALVCPVFLLLLLGIFDVGQMAYAKAVLSGAVEKAVRDGTIETVNTATVDAAVRAAIKPVLPNAIVDVERRSYYDFSDVGRAEKFTDTNGNGRCDNGENYTDENKSNAWEADVGKINSNGGSGDVVLFTATATYTPIFTARFMSNFNQSRKIVAIGVRKNQPYSNQAGYGSVVRTCT